MKLPREPFEVTLGDRVANWLLGLSVAAVIVGFTIQGIRSLLL